MDTNIKKPRVSVVMPVYNGERYIADSIKSVLNQTFKDFELLVINDCSTDNTLKVLSAFTDSRLIILNNEKNIGSAASRTKAIAQSSAEYIAILDSDDLAYLTRLQKQVSFMDAHPDFGMIASWVKIIDHTGKATGVVLKDRTPSEKVHSTLLFHNIFACSSAMLRKSALPENPFRQETMPVEDIDLWLRMLENGSKFGTLHEVLIAYRSHESGISKVFSGRRQEIFNGLIRGELRKLGVTATDKELMIHRTNFGYAGSDLGEFLKEREVWLLKLREQNKNVRVYPEKIFNEVVAQKFLDTCRSNRQPKISMWKIFWQSDLSKSLNLREAWFDLVKFALKTLLRKN